MAVQENHDLVDDPLLRPSCCDALSVDRADTINLAQSIRLGFDDVEHLHRACILFQ
jgi:hypothetical protein